MNQSKTMEITPTIQWFAESGACLAAFGDEVGSDVFIIAAGVGILVFVHYFGRSIPENWNGFRIVCYFCVVVVMAIGAGLLSQLGNPTPEKARHVFWVSFICLTISSVSGLIIGFKSLDLARRRQENEPES
jgi:hypothetical protein